MTSLFDFLKRIISRRNDRGGASPTEELWVADFASPKSAPFQAIDAPSYAADYHEASLRLSLKKTELFAWTEAAPREVGDFVLEGECEFGPNSPYASCGFLFRQADEANFYALLVSNHGYLRLDAVFGGKPRTVVAWTECPKPMASTFLLRIIARASQFLVYVDDEWALEAVDETFRSGSLAFAAQNYGEAERLEVSLSSFFVESRRYELETWFYRGSYFESASAEARFRLASTYFAMGEWLSAAVQLKKLEKKRPLGAEELFLKAEAYLRLELYDEAEKAIEDCLTLTPGKKEAIEEKANLLYLRNRYPELRDYSQSLLLSEPDSPRLWVLSGHARFNLGDYIGAAEDYGRAAKAAPQEPIIHMNEGRAREQAGDKLGASKAYLAAARGFFDSEADEDLALALARLEELDPRNPELGATKAKVLYRQGKKKEAAAAIRKLVKEGSADSALHYLAGLLDIEEGHREKALGHLEKALELEPTYALYAFRLAESLFILGRAEAKPAIARALLLGPEDGWICNLAGEALLRELVLMPSIEDEAWRSKAEEARKLLVSAQGRLPGRVEPAVNLAELESLSGDIEAALAALAGFPEEAAAHNQAGNVFARVGRLEEAAKRYEIACSLEAWKGEYQANLAAAYLELERYSEAEDRIRKALDLDSSPRALLLAGNLALVYGDWVRAEASYRLGLEAAPDDPDLLFALGRDYLQTRKLKKVEDCLAKLAKVDPAKAARLEGEVLDLTTEILSCAACGRSWRLARELPAQSGASIRAMPPDDSPAGACPRCGKIFCIGCRKADLVENRFTCPDCHEALKLSDNRLRWLVREGLKRAALSPAPSDAQSDAQRASDKGPIA